MRADVFIGESDHEVPFIVLNSILMHMSTKNIRIPRVTDRTRKKNTRNELIERYVIDVVI